MANGKQGRGWRIKGQQKQPTQAFVSNIVGLESHTFDCGHARNAAQFEKTREEFGLWCQRKFEYGGNDVCKSINDMEMVEIEIPDVNDDEEMKKVEALSTIKQKLWSINYEKQDKREKALESASRKAFGVCLKLCSPQLSTRLEGTTGFGEIKKSEDMIELLKMIRGICCKFGDTHQGVWALTQAKKQTYLFVQGNNMSNDAYLKQFKAHIDTVEAHGGTFSDEPGLIEAEFEIAGIKATTAKTVWEKATDNQLISAKEKARAKVIASMFLSGANYNRYREITNELANEWTLGEDKYPTTLEEAVRMLNNYKVRQTFSQPSQQSRGEDKEMAFVEVDGNSEDFRNMSAEEKKKKRKCHTLPTQMQTQAREETKARAG